jgi:hypothetical protein
MTGTPPVALDAGVRAGRHLPNQSRGGTHFFEWASARGK